MRTIRTVLAAGLAVGVFANAGCGDGPKSEVPKNLNQKLPPPPVSSDSGGKAKPQNPSNTAN